MRRRPGGKGESGSALLAALAVALLLGIALDLVAASLALRMRELRREQRVAELDALADAALAETLAELSRSGAFSGVDRHAFAGGELSSEVERISSGPLAVYRVTATGSRDGWTRSVEARVERSLTGTRVTSWALLAPPP